MLLGDRLHAVEQLPLALREGRRRRGARGGRFGRASNALDLRRLLRLGGVIAERGALVVCVRGAGEEVGFVIDLGLRFGGRPFPLALDRGAMDLEAAGERLDRGEQALLETDDEQPRGRLRAT